MPETRKETIKQNILYILLDQQRIDMLGAYGHPVVKTPHIDALAEEGILFTGAYTPSALCGPARTSLFTGLIPTDHGVTQNAETGSMRYRKADPLPGVGNLGDHLSDYEKIYLGKWHIAETTLPSDYGFKGHDFPGYGYPGTGVYKNLVFNQGPGKENNRYREWLEQKGFGKITLDNVFFGMNPNLRVQELYGDLDCPAEATIPAFLADEACRYIGKRELEKPFFLWLNFWGPHTPCLLPREYVNMYEEAEIPEDPGFLENFSSKPRHQEHISYMWGVHNLTWEQWSRIIRYYYGYISLIDSCIGKVVERLKSEGLYETTTIILTADHGDAMGAHRLIEKGEFMYDETYRIPMIMRSPQVKHPGRVCEDFIYLHDLFPTALDIAGELRADNGGQTLSLLPYNRDEGYHNNRDHAYAQFTGHFTDFSQRMLREKRYKFIFNTGTFGELYDLEDDPHELNNRIDDPAYAAVKKRMIQKLLTEMKQLNDPVSGWLSRIQDYY